MAKSSYKITPVLLQLLFIVSICFGQNFSKHYLNGNDLQDKNEYVASIRQYSKAIKSDPNIKEYYYRRAKSYRKVGKYKEALADIDKCLAIDKNYKEGHFEKGAMSVMLKNNLEGLKEFSIAIGIDSTYAKAFMGRGAVYFLLSKYDTALIDYEKSLKLDPNNETVYYDIGITYAELNRYDEAITFLNEALRRENVHLSFYERGRCLYEIQEYELAEMDFQNALIFNDKLDPWEKIDNGRSYYHKGLSNVRLNKIKEACSDFENALSNNYSNAQSEYKKCNCSQLLSENNDKNDIKANTDTAQSISVEIYPNPIQTYAIITTSKKKQSLNLNLKIVNMEGKTVQLINNIGDSYVFNRREILSGTYLFIISYNEEIVSSQKIIIQ